ncbi:hypothetical protein [Kaistia sp. MMO-174]|uniref:hypothetical protein n=1 Tax=Kaistia sp. MMO-174 TaxID=3081256 RepID=UPI00301616C8
MARTSAKAAAEPEGSRLPPEAAAALLATTPETLKRLAQQGVIPGTEGGTYPAGRLIQQYVAHISSDECGLQDASELIMVSKERIRQLVEAGYITKLRANRYSKRGVVQGYIRFLKDEERRSSKSATASKVGEARAREIELRIAQKEHRICDTEDAIGVVEEIVGMYRSELSGLPARLARNDLPLRREIEKNVNGILDRVSATLAKRALALRTGGEAFEADAEDVA